MGILILSIICLVIGALLGLIFRAILRRRLRSTIKTILIGAAGGALGGLLVIIVLYRAARLIEIFAGGFTGAIVFLISSAILAKQNVSSSASSYLPATAAAIVPPPVYSENSTQLPPTMPPAQFPPNNLPTLEKHEFQIKICPACKNTYTDITLNFCLDDGAHLSKVINAQARQSPEETLLSPKFH